MKPFSLALLGGTFLTACALQPPVPAPQAALAPTPAPFSLGSNATPTPVAATPWPLPVAGLLAAGGDREFQATSSDTLALLVVNPTQAAATAQMAVDPAGIDPNAPSPTPTNSPVAGAPEAPEPGLDPVAGPVVTSGGDFAGNSVLRAGNPLDNLGDASRQPPTRNTLAVETPVVGTQTTFWVNDGDATLGGDRQRVATLRVASPHVHFWLDGESAATITDARVQALDAAFEQQILPRLTPVFGSPDVAAGTAIDVVISPWLGQDPALKGLMGYFWPRDVLPLAGTGTDLRQHSNQRHVFFLASSLLAEPDVTCFGTLAHEYQHMLMFDAKSRATGGAKTEETWLDEGCAMLAMDLAGYGLPAGDPFVAGEVGNFRANPAAYSLTDWTHNPHGYSYGLSYLFLRYMVDRFGTGVVHEIQQTPLTGVMGLEQVAQQHGTTFPQVFLDWATSVWQSSTGVTAQRVTQPGSLSLRSWGIAPLQLPGVELGRRTLTLTSGSSPIEVLGGSP